MRKITISKLPKLLQTVHKAQVKWKNDNYSESVHDFQNEIESILELLNLYAKWKSKFHDEKITQKMFPEIFMDGISSLHFALLGLYKYSNMCLRSQLETALRLIYFIDHKREYNWWLQDNEWYRKQSLSYVWGSDFSYFKELKNIRDFDNACDGPKKIFSAKKKKGDLLENIYGQLSKSIHASATHFQTSTGRYSPRYTKNKMEEWISNFKKIQCYIFICLILVFPEEFKKMIASDQDVILNKGIGDADFIRIIKTVI
ncbi:MAG: hypothetical protein ABII22_04470 [Candidatus Micrarchaeota archaeon]